MSRSSFTKTYRPIPVLIGSLLIFAIICFVFILLWSVGLFLTKTPDPASNGLPSVLWLASLALATAAITVLTRGGTVYPALFLALLGTVLSCFFAGEGVVTFGGVLLKILFSLLTAVAAFTICKLIILIRNPYAGSRQPRYPSGVKKSRRLFARQRRQENNDDKPLMIQIDDEDLLGFEEHDNKKDY